MAALTGSRLNVHSRHLAEKFHPQADAFDEIEGRDLRRVLHEALYQLPEKYRAPVVLCYLEGKTNEEAARELGWPAGSMSRRLDRARSLLKHRLARSGLMILGLVCAAVLIPKVVTRDRTVGAERAVVRQVMASFRTADGDELDLPGLLERLARGDSGIPATEQLGALARKSEWVADRLIAHDPGPDRAIWKGKAARMKGAAADLARAVVQEDRLAMLGAARQLDATCVGCHELFRSGSSVSGPRPSPWIE